MKVAVTGIGLISDVGRGIVAHANALRASDTRLAPLTAFSPGDLPALPVGQVAKADLDGDLHLGACEQLTLSAVRDALGGRAPSGEGVFCLGTTTGGIPESEQHFLSKKADEPLPSRDLLRHHPLGAVADRVAQRLGFFGERHTFSTACSSSANAIGFAAMAIEGGAPWAIAGGVDALCRLTYAGFQSLRLLSPFPCRPFDATRKGLCLGEAAAFLFMESLSSAKASGREVLGYVSGWGLSADAYHATAPHPQGLGAIAAMKLALLDAGVSPGEIGYINAHGTGTEANDRVEALALRTVFGDTTPWVSSTKGLTGHTLGAAGALEAGLSLLSMREGYVPSTLGFSSADAAMALNQVPRGGTKASVAHVLSTSFGFGGNNAALVLSKADAS